MNLWITADDYGLSPAVNGAIEELAEQGAISAVSVMVHEGAELGSIERLARAGVAIGLHLCFTRERPLVRELGQRGGRLPAGYKHLFAQLTVRPGLLTRIADEADAQVDRLLAAGVAVDFINSHEHVHLFPPLWPIALRAARRARASAVRIALGQRVDLTPDGLLAAASRASWAVARPAPSLAVMSPIGVRRAGALTVAAIERLLARPFEARPGRNLELCVHPPEATEGLLTSAALRDLFARRGVRVLRGRPSR